MARPKVIIADEDASYIVPLQFKFVTDFFNKIDLEIITDRAYFDEYFSRPQNAEILIISDDLYDSSLQRHNIQNIFVMMEQYDEGSTGELNVNQIGISSYSSYEEGGFEDIPRIFVLLDNYTAFREIYGDTYEEEFIYILREGLACGR